MKKRLGLVLMLSIILCVFGCDSTKEYQATFKKSTKFEFVEDGVEYAEVIHENDVLTFHQFIEENGIGYALFSYKDTPKVKLSLGHKIKENVYERAIIEVK